MDRNQPLTTYIRDLLNPLKKHVFPRGGRDEFWGRETVFSQLAKRTPFSWRPADNCSIFFPEVNISEARKEPAKEIIQKLKKIISCQPRPQGAIPWHASLFFSHILLFCPLVLKLQNSSYTHCNSERQKRALDYRSSFILCILPGKEKNCWGNCQMYRN